MAAVGAHRGSSAQQKKKLLVDALLLALRHSEVARVVDMGTLEYFLDSSYHDMVRGDSIDLGKLWDVLVKEPGIEPRMIFPPLLAYKAWEERLGMTVFLPAPVKDLSAGFCLQAEMIICAACPFLFETPCPPGTVELFFQWNGCIDSRSTNCLPVSLALGRICTP